ncbi:MAG TPA: Smr/MutS family protein [Candidatus Limnocylindrales bacterium]|nr:Smr/MutS family protein [Candidatus Limnocylindrales bacterium]
MDLLARTLEALDWPFMARELASHARTAAGARAAAEVELHKDTGAIAESLDAIEEIHALLEARAGAPPVGGVEDIAEPLLRAARGEVLDLADLRAVRSTLAALAELARFLARHAQAAPTLARLGAAIELDRKLCATFEAALDERGELSERTYPMLAQLRQRIAALERRVRSVMESLLESPELADVLQERYITIRDDRYVLPIKAQAKGMGLGIVHDASRTGQTVFVEPAQVVPIGNERRMAESELFEEDRRIRGDLSETLGRHADTLRGALEAATVLDVACARAELATRLGATRPRIGVSGIIDLRHARHPVLALGTDVVGNDLCLSEERPVLVLTGPNAGGKTVAMKTIGLCALLVRAGCFVPAAPGSRVDVFDPILADIGDMQTVHGGLSSFSAHLTTLKAMLETAGAGTLLLLDEIASGTDPAQGGALAGAVIERLADVGARVVATTHYAQVKAMSARDSRVEVAALEYREGRPTYRVVSGLAGESHALAAALRIGIEEALVARARELMDEGERALHEALAALEVERERARDASLRADLAASDLAARQNALAEREQRIRHHAREIQEDQARAFLERLRAADEEVRRRIRELREDPSRQTATRAGMAIAAARAATALPREQQPAASREPAVGDRVRLLRLGTVGEVLAVRDGEVEVSAGSLTIRARPADVEVVSGAEARRHVRAHRSRLASRSTADADRDALAQKTMQDDRALEDALRMASNTLDLRGARVEEGLERLERFLDESMLAGRDAVFVLHGHGTGALKAAVRRALSASKYVEASGAASEEQGGDAFTVARLRG